MALAFKAKCRGNMVYNLLENKDYGFLVIKLQRLATVLDTYLAFS